MPRDGSGVYGLPSGTHGAPNTTIASAPYNAYVDDVTQDLNAPRPILSGGTGAVNAIAAMKNLNGEITNQVVTNYDSDVIYSGSFSSASTATNPPVAGHSFVGFIYAKDAGNIVLEARDESDTTSPGRRYIREKIAGTWGPWHAGDHNIFGDAEGISSVLGDMFFGIKGTAPSSKFIVNDKADASGSNLLQVLKGGTSIVRPTTDQNLVIANAAGTMALSALKDDMATGIPLAITTTALTVSSIAVSFSSTPTIPTMATTDNSTKAATTAYVKNNLASYLPLTGGTISGNLAATGWLMAQSGVLYLNAAASRYLQWTSDTYNFGGTTVNASNGRLWGSGDFANPGAPGNSGFLSNGRLAFAADFSHTSSMQEPYPGAVCTGNSIGFSALSTRYRWMQLYTTGWFTVGTA